MRQTLTILGHTISAVLLLTAAASAYAGQVEICHRPPGNPESWHIIKVDESAWPAHQAHGDLEGMCSDHCDDLCGDDNACTQDVASDDGDCTCFDASRPPVNCDDTNVCTADSCDPIDGCEYAPSNNGASCDDGDPETGDGVCTEGVCEGLADLYVPNPCLNGGLCDAGSGACTCINGYLGTYCENPPANPCRPNPCQNGGTSTASGVDYSCDCAGGYTGGHCEIPPSPTCHTCAEDNPCAPENIADENFYHTHCDPTMFVQCDQWGGCFEMPCAPGTVWDQEAYTCVHA